VRNARLASLALALALAVALAFAAAGCKPTSTSDPPEPSASPQASAIPAPLATLPSTTSSAAPTVAQADAAPPPLPMRPDRATAPDVLLRDLPGYTLQATLRSGDPQAFVKAPEVSVTGMEAARKRTEARLVIDVAQARTRLAITGRGFVLPEGAELRARSDRYGYVLLMPEATSYRIAAPGALRALLGERRLDVAPLSPAEITPSGEGARRLGYRTKKVDVATRAANGTFEIARVADASDGGALLCRVLLDLMNAPPSTPLCASDEVPLHAELRWTTRGSFEFTATSIVRRLDLPAQQLAAPPPSAAYAGGALAPQAAEILLTPAELTALRNGPTDTPGVHEKESHATLKLANSTDELRFLWLDGIPIAWVAPGARLDVPLLRGRYSIEWRTFLGDALDPAKVVTLPATSECGAVDGGL
jgi:hypothetical protein